MTAHTQGRIEPKVMAITINEVQGTFFVVAVPDTNYAVAITGTVVDSKENQDKSFAEAERIAVCWNACIDIDTEQLLILEDNDTTLKKRYEALQSCNADLLAALQEIDNWLVCSAIATPEDMAQSFQHMQGVASAAIAKAKGGAV